MWMWWVWRFWIIGLSLVLDRWVSNRELLWFCVWIVGLLLKINWWVCVCICVCFLADFWVCVFFFVFGWREIFCWVCVCICVCFLADFWVCVFFFVFGWREIFCWVCVCVLTGDRFVFLCLADKRDLLLGLCLCSCWRSVCVLCSWICVLVFAFLSSVFWVCVLVVFVLVVLRFGSGSGFFLKKISGHVIFCF